MVVNGKGFCRFVFGCVCTQVRVFCWGSRRCSVAIEFEGFGYVLVVAALTGTLELMGYSSRHCGLFGGIG